MSTPTEPAQPPARPEPHDDMEGDPTPVRRPVRKTFPNLHRRPRPAEPAPAEPVLVAQPATRNRTPRRRPRITPPTQEELDALPVEKRQELHDARRQRPWQHLTSLGVLFGVLFTAGGLYYTGQTWQTGQEALKATQQQQITDRYAKAVEQLGSAKSVEVRIGGLYALKRIARDSPPDAETIEDVVVAFILEHDLDVAATPAPKGAASRTSAQRRPGSDVSAALRVLGVISKSRGSHPDISSAQFAQADWRGVNLSGAYLSGVDLSRADLSSANLSGADLSGANLRRADLRRANLSRADLSRANLRGADLRDGAILSFANLSRTDLRGANLSRADLRLLQLINSMNLGSLGPISGAILRSANLSLADLSGADLRGADLRSASLSGADLSGADLRRASLGGADLRDADLVDADLSGADLVDADLVDADLSHDTILRSANLSRANLSGADLGGADLRSASLSGADLSLADLGGADLRDADLRDASLGGADLGGADLRAIAGKTAAEIKAMAITDAKTKF